MNKPLFQSLFALREGKNKKLKKLFIQLIVIFVSFNSLLIPQIVISYEKRVIIISFYLINGNKKMI